MNQTESKYHHSVSIWLWTGAVLILLMLVIGGITRLTGSGLSMTDWNLLMGAVPPTGDTEWAEAFDRYKQFPEYRQLNSGMSLSEFKEIYFWEYLHRLIGRLTGIVFIGPLLWFSFRGYFDSRQLKRLSMLFLLGAAQGTMGWIMVKSGLLELPYVSHYRLTMHLLLAFVLFGYCIWLALDLQYKPLPATGIRNRNETTGIFAWMYAIAGLLLFQVAWGAFVAGLKAGKIYNSFPFMNEGIMPVNAWVMDPLMLNLFENPGMVQWTHRVIGTILALVVLLFWLRISSLNLDRHIHHLSLSMLALVLMQYLLGVFTLVLHVPITLAVAHQLVALLIWGSWIVLMHRLKTGQKNLVRNQTNLS